MIKKYRIIEKRPNGLPSLKMTFKGFSHRVDESDLWVALVDIEGDIVGYSLDSPESIKSLESYLNYRVGKDSFEIINLYKRSEQ